MGEIYVNVIQRPHFGPRLVDALQVAALAHAGPTVFHCTAGKDRTGMFAAFLLGILGCETTTWSGTTPYPLPIWRD